MIIHSYIKRDKKHKAEILCTNYDDFLEQYEKSQCDCHFNGNCIKGVCQCFEGWDPLTNCEKRMIGKEQ